MDTPFLRIEESGDVFPLGDEVTTIGRGQGVDIRLDDPSVSRLHAELYRRGPYVYVVDLGLSRNGTRVNGRPVARRVLDEVSGLVPGVAHVEVDAESNLELVRRLDVRRTPTVLVLDAHGAVVRRASGQPRKADVLAALGEAVA